MFDTVSPRWDNQGFKRSSRRKTAFTQEVSYLRRRAPDVTATVCKLRRTMWIAQAQQVGRCERHAMVPRRRDKRRNRGPVAGARPVHVAIGVRGKLHCRDGTLPRKSRSAMSAKASSAISAARAAQHDRVFSASSSRKPARRTTMAPML